VRTESGRRSYCFKADRFIYCPNNHAESPDRPFARCAVLNCALLKLTWHHAFLSRGVVIPGFHQSVVIQSAEDRQLRRACWNNARRSSSRASRSALSALDNPETRVCEAPAPEKPPRDLSSTPKLARAR